MSSHWPNTISSYDTFLTLLCIKNKYQIFIKFESQLDGYFCPSYGPLITQYASVPLWTAVCQIFLYGPATFFLRDSDLYKISADYFPCLALTHRDLAHTELCLLKDSITYSYLHLVIWLTMEESCHIRWCPNHMLSLITDKIDNTILCHMQRCWWNLDEVLLELKKWKLR